MFAQLNEPIILIVRSRDIRRKSLPRQHNSAKALSGRAEYKELLQLSFLIRPDGLDITPRSFMKLFRIHFSPCIAYNDRIRRQKIVPILHVLSSITTSTQTHQSEKCRKLKHSSAQKSPPTESNVGGRKVGYSLLLCEIARSPEDDNSDILLQFNFPADISVNTDDWWG